MTIRTYLRTSTTAQDLDGQKHIIEKYLAARNLEAQYTYADQQSGAVPWKDRMLSRALADSSPGDTILVADISRIGRSTIGILTFLQAATEAKINVVAIANNITIDDSIHSTITVTVLALCAEIERTLLRQRTKSALDAKRANGDRLGRPPGTRKPSKLEPHAAEIERCLAAKVSIAALARLMSCSKQTLYDFIKRRAAAEALAATSRAQLHDDRTLDLWQGHKAPSSPSQPAAH